jgi:hypothetical protein
MAADHQIDKSFYGKSYLNLGDLVSGGLRR